MQLRLCKIRTCIQGNYLETYNKQDNYLGKLTYTAGANYAKRQLRQFSPGGNYAKANVKRT